MTVILSIATLLGGIAALWYFWDKIAAWWRPQTVPPPPPQEPQVKWVDTKYPADSGLQARLEVEGFTVSWCAESKLARRIDLDGYEIAVEKIGEAESRIYKVKSEPSNLVLIRKRK